MKSISTKLFIDGSPRASSGTGRLTQIRPATGEPFAEVEAATTRDIEAAIAGAHRAYTESWRDLPPGRRAEILFAVSRILRENAEDLAQLECANIGKPISDARDEVLMGARTFEYYAGGISRLCGQTIPVGRGGFDFTLRQPLGVVAAITPWNFPFPIACWKVAPALAAGNTVVLKPASQSPLTAIRLGELVSEAGLPDGVLQVVPGAGRDIGDALVSDRRIRKISFTGSTEVGARLMALAAPDIKRVSLELGGKSPNIVFADADWERAADESPMSVFANAGQDCCARSRVFVERTISEAFIERFVAATRSLQVGDPAVDTTQIGPLISRAQREQSERFVREAVNRGATLLCGGDPLDSPGFFLRPAVLTDVDSSDPVWREEVFGPVVCIRPFDDESAMIQEANDTPYGLSGSVWTRDIDRALRVARLIESGVLSVNTHASVHLEAPFGGFKRSGLGRDLGMSAMEGYTELKNVYVG